MTETVSSSNLEIVKSIPDIEHSIGSTEPEDYRSVTCRYYTKLYSLDQDREKAEDILVLNHSNKICLITLAPTHPVLAHNLSINKVNFEVSKKVDRKSNKTSGKSKKGGQALETTSVLAIVETDGGSFPVKVRRRRRRTLLTLFISGRSSREADLCERGVDNRARQAVLPS